MLLGGLNIKPATTLHRRSRKSSNSFEDSVAIAAVVGVSVVVLSTAVVSVTDAIIVAALISVAAVVVFTDTVGGTVSGGNVVFVGGLEGLSRMGAGEGWSTEECEMRNVCCSSEGRPFVRSVCGRVDGSMGKVGVLLEGLDGLIGVLDALTG